MAVHSLHGQALVVYKHLEHHSFQPQEHQSKLYSHLFPFHYKTLQNLQLLWRVLQVIHLLLLCNNDIELIYQTILKRQNRTDQILRPLMQVEIKYFPVLFYLFYLDKTFLLDCLNSASSPRQFVSFVLSTVEIQMGSVMRTVRQKTQLLIQVKIPQLLQR